MQIAPEYMPALQRELSAHRRRIASTSPHLFAKIYHNAGLGGYGSSSYIDSVMLRDRDAATAWNAASDGTMEERVYYAQNFRHDVSALITSDGRMIEWIKYSSYGVPWSLPAGDTDSDGDFDATDASAITGTYDVRKDVNLEGTVDIDDFLDAFDLNNGYVNQGWSKLGLTKWGNRKGYAGYEGDTALAGTKWHVRHRVLESELGRWMRRDPLGYVDGSSLTLYTLGNPVRLIDQNGLAHGFPCYTCGISGPPKELLPLPPGDEVPVPRPIPDIKCGTDATEPCTTKCQNIDGDGGVTWDESGDGSYTACCVCIGNILDNDEWRDDIPAGPGMDMGLDIMIHCTDHHEQTHMRQDYSKPPFDDVDCAEAQAYANEIACVKANRWRCGGNSDCNEMMDRLELIYNSRRLTHSLKCNVNPPFNGRYPGY